MSQSSKTVSKGATLRTSSSSGSDGPLSNLSRRTLLRGAAAAIGLAATPSLISACSSSSSAGTGAGATSAASVAGSTLTLGSNYSDVGTKPAFAALADQAASATSVAVTVNTVAHNDFQNNITAYLQGTPDSLATWFAGYRMQ